MSKTFFIGGWGIASESYRIFFGEDTILLPPLPDSITKLKESFSEGDVVAGYSLGAWLLLDSAARGEFFAEKTSLFAPFSAFPEEKKLGGKVSTTQIKFLRRWLKKDWYSAISDFYSRAGLSFALKNTEPPEPLQELDTGLAILQEGCIQIVPAEKIASWEIILGAQDALLDAETVAKAFSGCNIKIVPAGTHDLKSLL